MLNILKNTINRVFASGVDSDASAFITATGLSGTTQKSAITTLVKDLKSSGLWSKMKAVYPMVTDNRNSLYYTEDYSNALWYKTNATITTNTTVAPNGTLTADTLTDDTAGAFHFLSSSVSPAGQNGNNTVSIYAKANTLNWLSAYVYDGTTAFFTYFNLSNGTVGTNASGNTATIVDAGNGWYRCIITRNYNATAGGAGCGFMTANADGVNSYVGTGKSIHLWGAQFETGSTASTYQPIATTPSAFMASQMKYNLKDARDLDAAFRLTWSGGWTYSATGATPNGTNAYADTKLVPSTILTTSSAHFSKYNRTNDLVGNKIDGAISADSTKYMQQNYSAGNGIVGDLAALMAYTATDTRGLFTATRTSTSLSKVFRNSNQVTTSSVSITGLPDRSLYFGGRNDGVTSFYNSYQIAFSSIGDGLTDQDTLLLNQIVEKYQVALSRGVQAAQSFYYNSAYSNEANTYLYSTQITGTTQVSAINTLINGLKANNLWSKMKAVYPFVTDKWNMLSYTEDFSNAAWSKGGGTTVTANSTTAPDGTLTADTIVLPNTGTISQSLVSSSHNAHTLSIYLKASTNTTIKLGFLSPGSVVVCNVTTEWQRFTYTYSFAGTTYPQLYNDTGSTVTLFAWGAQAELGTSASTYQPVLGANSYSSNVAAQMKFNLVNPQDSDAAFRLAFSGGWTYSTNGAQPNGTNGYADTKLNDSILTPNSSHLSIYSRTNSSASSYDMGIFNGANGIWMMLRNAVDQYRAGVFQTGASGELSAANTNSQGYYFIGKNGSTLASIYKNGTLSISGTKLDTSATNTTVFLSTLNQNGSPAYGFSARQISFATIGNGFSDAEALILYNLIQQYQTDLSRQV